MNCLIKLKKYWSRASFLFLFLHVFCLPSSYGDSSKLKLEYEVKKAWHAIQLGLVVEARQEMELIYKNFPEYSLIKLCRFIVNEAGNQLQFEEVYRLVFERICEVQEPHQIARGISFLSLARNKTLLKIYIQWLKKYPDEQRRLNVFISVLPKARLNFPHYLEMIQSFKNGKFRRQAYLALVSQYPFPELIQKYLRFRRKNARVPDGPEDLLIKITAQLMTPKGESEISTREMWKRCRNAGSTGEFLQFWKVACAYQIKKKDPSLEKEVTAFIASYPIGSVFSVVDNLQKYPPELIERVMK